MPAPLRAAIEAFEAGAAPLAVETGAWSALRDEASPLRLAVFVEEQRVPLDLEWDAADEGAVHAVARNLLGHAVATGRLLAGEARVGAHRPHGGRARHPRQRRRARGARRAARRSRRRGDREVVLHAQCAAVAFYERAGFDARGPVFEEAGIAHVEMARAP